MRLEELTATSPIDGRYRNKTTELSEYLSEYGLIKYRVRVEIEYFIALCRYKLPQLKEVDKSIFEDLRKNIPGIYYCRCAGNKRY
jgi:adenylosuccinate lyase